ncbi:MAG TPA: NHL repeat-containing protein [Streptosporangiaceae bacterium]|nr:NHL repeat-containing protein [Streptosporangiaceae bacterium]
MRTIRVGAAAGRAAEGPPAQPPPEVRGGWQAGPWVGAPSPGGLALPSAQPTASWLYAPRGVHLGTHAGHDLLVVADTGNHRVLIWHGLPTSDEQPCDVVLGQPDTTSEGPAASGRGPRRGMNLPTGVLVHDGMLVVADAWHHRVLIYREVPAQDYAEPDLILGQPGPDCVLPNRGGGCGARSLYWPFGVAVVEGRFYVADTGNRRVLGWQGGIPTSGGIAPDLVLGQPGATCRDENRGGPPGPASFRWPHDITGVPGLLLVADAGNHRMLGWHPHPGQDRDADLVIGQPGFDTAGEWPYGPQRGDALRFPYAADADAGRLAVADTANNRVLVWEQFPGQDGAARDGAAWDGAGRGARPADVVLGQPDFAANGENRWQGVERDSLCWPYGLSLRGDTLAVADLGNNRVVIWRRP